MGTPAFMAYEQARGLWDEVDARTDLWAVGAMMFTLLSGRCVHEGRTTQEVLLAAMTKAAPPLVQVVHNASPAVAHLVDRALAQDKEKRWADARRMQERVTSAYHDRFKVPISTAPRLTVPETVPNRTLPSADAHPLPVRLPTTGQPVARSGATQARPLPVVALVLGGGGVMLMAIVIVVVVSTTRRTSKHEEPGSSSRTTATQPATSPTVTLSAAPSASPAIAATDLPTVAPSGVASKSTAKPLTTTPVPTGSTVKPNCDPPFVVDPGSGKRTWKVECL
jgi:serine/threonine-protein kinase